MAATKSREPSQAPQNEVRELIAVLRDSDLRKKEPTRVAAAIKRLGELRAEAAVDDLVALLGFRQTLPWERNGENEWNEIRLVTPADRYPAVAALSEIGKQALPSLVLVISQNKPDSPLSQNAEFTILTIYRADLLEGVQFLREAAAKAPAGPAGERLSAAADRLEGTYEKLRQTKRQTKP